MSDFIQNPEDDSLQINVGLLRRIKASILADNQSFDMSVGANKSYSRNQEALKVHPCFTEACVAGWAVFLAKGRIEHDFWMWDVMRGSVTASKGIFNTARVELGLTEDQAKRLFYLSSHVNQDKNDEEDFEPCWPTDLEDELVDNLNPADYAHNAKVAAERIDLFIETAGAE